MNEASKHPKEPERGLGRRGYAGLILVGVLVVSVAARALFFGGSGEQGPSSGSSSTLAPTGLVPGEPGSGSGGESVPAESRARETVPIVTEAAFFGVIGFAVGYASRKAVKVGLFVLALLFVGLQVLSHLGILTIDWNRALEVTNQLVFNVKEGQTFTEVMKDRIPSVGALVAGYFLGFRRG